MRGLQLHSIAGAVALAAASPTASQGRPLVVPFDFSRSEIVLDVSVAGKPLHMFLDTGVSPSLIDSATATALGLKIDHAGGGEASGQGDDAHAMVYPTSIDGLVIGGRRFSPVEALAIDMTAISRAFGSPLQGTLGHSFLAGKVVLIDYQARTLTIFDQSAQVSAELAKCRKVWRTRLRPFRGDTDPVVELNIGSARLPATIDTGSDGNVELYQQALDEPRVRAALVEESSHTETGSRGAYTVKVDRLTAPISLGPFVLPAGQTVTVSTAEDRPANVGNKLLTSMRLKLLLDYRNGQIAFMGDCAK